MQQVIGGMTLKAPRGRDVPTDVVLVSGQTMHPDEHGRLTVAVGSTEARALLEAGWQLATPEQR